MSLISFQGAEIFLKFCPTVYDLFEVFQFPVYSSATPFHFLSSMYQPPREVVGGGISVAIRSTVLSSPNEARIVLHSCVPTGIDLRLHVI
jgi:hypothetical protein